jgi:hypothetical protein
MMIRRMGITFDRFEQSLNTLCLVDDLARQAFARSANSVRMLDAAHDKLYEYKIPVLGTID